MTPKVSVLMPAYNAEQYIDEAIQSILHQTMQDFELIIVDDGSTDGTWGVVQGYVSRDARIRSYKNDSNVGVSKTRNRLLALAEGEYVAWQDADDISIKHRLQKQYEFMQAHPEVGMCGGFLEFFYPDGRAFVRSYAADDTSLRANIFRYSPVSQGVAMLRTSIIYRLGGFDERLPQAEDLDFSFRLGLISTFANLQEVLLRYRQHDSISAIRLKENMIYSTFVRMKYLTKRQYGSVSMSNALSSLAPVPLIILPKKIIIHVFSLIRDAAPMPIRLNNDRASEVMVDLGCGKKKVPGAIGVDAKSLPGVDIVHDIGKDPLPFEDGSVDVVYANMILEHVPDLLWTMGDIHRILKNGGILKAKVPYYNSMNAYSDPTHKNFFTEKTFLYFTHDAELNYYVDYKFTMLAQELRNNSTSITEKIRNYLPFKHLLKNFIFNMFDEIYVELKKEV